jgi:hypothetical protein
VCGYVEMRGEEEEKVVCMKEKKKCEKHAGWEVIRKLEHQQELVRGDMQRNLLCHMAFLTQDRLRKRNTLGVECGK